MEKRVGESPVEVKGNMRRFKGEAVFLFAGEQRWERVTGDESISNLKECLLVPADFREKVRPALHPGSTLVVTSEPGADRGGRSREIMAAQ